MPQIVNIEGATLYLGDCLELLPQIQADAVVTDPPYGIGYSHTAGSLPKNWRQKSARRNAGPIEGDDKPFDPAPLLSFGEVITWGADHYRGRLPETGRFLAWDKKAGFDFHDNFSDVEFAWHSESGSSRIINYLWKGVRQAGEKGHKKYHQSQKPIAVMEWCIKQLRGAAQTILDPYMGSGSTGVACANLVRKFVGVEIERRHFDIACERIAAAYAQQRLFA